MLPYRTALRQALRVGAAHATGDAHSAQVAKVLAVAYPLDAATLYEWASRRSLTGSELCELAVKQLEDVEQEPNGGPLDSP